MVELVPRGRKRLHGPVPFQAIPAASADILILHEILDKCEYKNMVPGGVSSSSFR